MFTNPQNFDSNSLDYFVGQKLHALDEIKNSQKELFWATVYLLFCLLMVGFGNYLFCWVPLTIFASLALAYEVRKALHWKDEAQKWCHRVSETLIAR